MCIYTSFTRTILGKFHLGSTVVIDLYTARTINGQRVSIMLEETRLAYTAHRIDLSKGEQHKASFLKLNPSARIPVLVDHDIDSSSAFVLTQSIAILQYLAEKTHHFLPESLSERARVFEWMSFYAVDIGAARFDAFYLQHRCKPKQDQAATLLRQRAHTLYRFIDQQLGLHEFLAGSSYSIADLALAPAVISQKEQLSEYPNLIRWLQQINKRPAVQRGMTIPKQGVKS